MNKILVVLLLILSLITNVYLVINILQPGNPKGSGVSNVTAVDGGENTYFKNELDNDSRDNLIQDLDSKLSESQRQVLTLTEAKERLEAELQTMKLRNAELIAEATTRPGGSVEPSDGSADVPSVEEVREKERSHVEFYESEAVDQEWAYTTQNQLNDFISDSALLGAMSINDITCKTSSCRVSITPLQEGLGGKIGAYFEMSQALHENKDFESYQSSSRHDDETNEVHVYLVRETSDD